MYIARSYVTRTVVVMKRRKGYVHIFIDFLLLKRLFYLFFFLFRVANIYTKDGELIVV